MPDDPLLYLVLASIVLGLGAWAGWNVGARRRRTPPPLPDEVWLCDGCRSFNDPVRESCYHCHRPRAGDARVVVPDPEFHLDQQLGRAKTSISWGRSSPWLGAEEPLRDAWLAEQARASELARPGPEAGPDEPPATDPGLEPPEPDPRPDPDRE